MLRDLPISGREAWPRHLSHVGRDDRAEPPDVRDLAMWRGAVDLASRHRADPASPDRCLSPTCLDPSPYPCFARRLAERCAAISRGWAVEPLTASQSSSRDR